MFWNYRIVLVDGKLSIHEAFYEDDGTLKGITESAVSPIGESVEQLKSDLNHYAEVLDLPVLDYEQVSWQVTSSSIRE